MRIGIVSRFSPNIAASATCIAPMTTLLDKVGWLGLALRMWLPIFNVVQRCVTQRHI